MAVRNTDVATVGRGIWPTSTEPIGETAVGEHQRERILVAATELFSKRGYGDTSAERICKKAKVSFPTFRKHFRDKEECFLAAFEAAVEEGAQRVAEATEAAGGKWADRVIAGLDAVLAGVVERPAQAWLCLVEALTAGAAGIERYEATVRRLIPALREGRAEMEDSSGLPELLEETILGGVAWAIHQRVTLGETGEVQELRRGLLGTLLRPYLGENRTDELIAREVTQSSAARR